MVVVLESLLAKHFITYVSVLTKATSSSFCQILFEYGFLCKWKKFIHTKKIKFHVAISVRESMLIDVAGIRNTNCSMWAPFTTAHYDFQGSCIAVIHVFDNLKTIKPFCSGSGCLNAFDVEWK